MSTEGASHELAELKALAAALQILAQVLDETRTVLEETNKVCKQTNNAGDCGCALLDPETGEPFKEIVLSRPLTFPEDAEQARLRRRVQEAMWAKLENRS